MKPDNDMSLDVVKCTMNYMISLLHAWAAFQYVQWDTVEFWGWTFICSHLCGLAMPTFFMISGYAGHFLFCSMWLHVCAPLVSGMKIGKMTLLISIFVVGGVGTMALVYTIMRRFLPRTTKMFDGTL